MLGTLYIVGTPIGNLEDLTFRAKRVLSEVEYVVCEDTRHTGKLLSYYDIKTKTIAHHKFNERASLDGILELLYNGKNVAIVSDAGMPGICDPGALLITEARKNGIKIETVPGPTAVTTALSFAGLQSSGFVFVGFLPEKQKAREKVLLEFKSTSLPLVLYCAPHDLEKVAKLIFETYGDRDVVVVKELTKMFESIYEGKLSEIEVNNKGEFVIIVLPEEKIVSNDDIIESLNKAIEEGRRVSEAVSKVAKDLGVPKNRVYDISIQIKHKS
ncbi:MAG TPA: 16S rRNA (cytidine(1402)-2'-O)-methyltransferase [Clostridia bacterium]|jgi:16S rRNA (cytidine1402-2'-O)-methyltransferase|nr:16S rRNA (cytidine(1402)-2'-O)-methyltransferase [Clostridia bacterium]